MKSKYVLLASAFLISGVTFAQKEELKAAEKALKSGNPSEAKTSLDKAEGLISNADDSQKAQFYFLKGNTGLELAKKKVDEGNNLLLSAKSFQELIAVEKASKKSKYTKDAETSLLTVKGLLVNSAIADNNSKNFKEGTEKLYQAYLLDKKDASYLYYAASNAVNALDYDKALAYYTELKDMNYSGEGTFYAAKNKLTEEFENFSTVAERDRMVKLGTYDSPKTITEPSKRGEIYKNIALIYNTKGDVAAAKKAVADARVANPDDSSLVLTEAELALKTNDLATYKQLITKVLDKNPTDPTLFYNLGVIAAQAKENDEAEKYYKKAIDLDPKYTNAYLNLAVMKLDADPAIVTEMNKLGSSAKDNKRYEELKAKREAIFKGALPYLQKANQLEPKNEAVYTTLLNVYGYLEMMDEAKALKASYKA
jgi:tetratricopeptide (TPR) repeat protein